MHFFLNTMFATGGALANANDKLVGNIVGVERSIIGNILNVVRIWGSGLALIMLTWMAISYFTADGRGAPWAIEQKAHIKGAQLRNFAIGVIIFIGASNILYFISTIVADMIAP